MAASTLTSKGQMTLPKAIRDKLRLKPGDRFEVSVEGQAIVLSPAILHLDDLCAILPRARKTLSTRDIDEAVRSRFLKS